MTDSHLASRMELVCGELVNMLDSSNVSIGKVKAFVDNWTYVLRVDEAGCYILRLPVGTRGDIRAAV